MSALPDKHMMDSKARVLLLVEDNPGDADLVAELLSEPSRERYRIIHVSRLDDGIEILRSQTVDVVVLDLALPDCSGLASLQAMRAQEKSVPIVVLTGTDDDELAHACIDAGAQDYLPKSEIRAQSLRRAIGYAISRLREAQVRELQAVLERFRALSSATQRTTVTAAIAGSGAVAMRDPRTFEQLVSSYFVLLEPYLHRQADTVVAPRTAMERIIAALGDVGGGPRDLLDVHVAALERALTRHPDDHSQSIVLEARLLALEMMGLLVDYYRVGHRRRPWET